MRKLIIAIFITITSTVAFGQFNKGRMLVGGTLGFQTNTTKTKSSSNTTVDGRENTFSINPQFGYFIINNLALGIGLDGSIYKFKSDSNSDNEYSANSIQVAPFVRYYIKPGIFFQGTYGIGTQTNKFSSQSGTEKVKGTASRWSLSGGYAILLNDHVAIEPMVGYGMNTVKVDTDSELKDINSGLFFRVGFQIYLGDRE